MAGPLGLFGKGGKISGALGLDPEGTQESIYGAPAEFAATGNTLSLSGPVDPGKLAIGKAASPTYTAAPAYVGAPGQADYVQSLYKGLGIQGPADISQEISAAGTTALNRAAQEQAARDADRFAAQGISNSGTAAALASRRGIDYGAAKAGIDMQAKQDAADRLAAFEAQGLGLASGYGSNVSQYNLGKAGQANEFNLGKSGQANQFELGRAGILGDYNLARTGQLSSGQLARDLAEHEANIMFPMTTRAGLQSGSQQAWTGLISGAAGAAGGGFGGGGGESGTNDWSMGLGQG